MMSPKDTILMIDEDSEMRDKNEAALLDRYHLLKAKNGIEGLELARTPPTPHLIILDLHMPLLSGHDVIKLLKEDERTRNCSVLFLSSADTPETIIESLQLGANDYIKKPFHPGELLARVEVQLKAAKIKRDLVIKAGALSIFPDSRKVTYQDTEIHLTLREFDLLRLLAAQIGITITREDITKKLWPDSKEGEHDRTIDVHVRALRKKLPALSKHIISVYGVGYRYEL